MDIMTIVALLRATTGATQFAVRALEAAENGDMEAAKAYLEEARKHYEGSRAAWDAAG